MAGDSEPLEVLDYASGRRVEWDVILRNVGWAMVWQVCVIGIAIAYFTFAAPRFVTMGGELGVDFSDLSLATCRLSRAISARPMESAAAAIALDLGLCLLLRRFGGCRALRWGSAILLVLILAVVVIGVVGLAMAMDNLISETRGVSGSRSGRGF